ncbi:MAG: MarR family winged helix-turn-helix transcriptional regulator [Steroidobacterales bacterium]
MRTPAIVSIMVALIVAAGRIGVSVNPGRRRSPGADRARKRRAAAAGRGPGADEPGGRVSAGALRGHLDHALRLAQLAALARSGALLSRFDLKPGQFAVLIVIDRNPGLSATDVCRVLGLQKANFAPLLRAFERRGLVQRRRFALDRRRQCLQLTAAGARLLARARRAHERDQRALSAHLGVAATQRLIALLLEIARRG